MAKTYDWDELLKQYASDYNKEGITPADWCARVGLPYSSAKRYITVKAAKTLSNSQTSKKTRKPREQPSAGRDDKGHFIKGHQIPECTGKNLDNLILFEKGNRAALKHGGYAKLQRAEDLEIGDEAEIIGLVAERRMYRARIASALRRIQEAEAELDDPSVRSDPEKASALNRTIRGASEAIDRAASRIESITKTLSTIRIDDVTVPHRISDRKRIDAAEAKLRAETDKLGRKSTAESVTYQFDW